MPYPVLTGEICGVFSEIYGEYIPGNIESAMLLEISDPFYSHGLTLIPAWISNHMPGKVWDEITYPFLNFNGWTVEV